MTQNWYIIYTWSGCAHTHQTSKMADQRVVLHNHKMLNVHTKKVSVQVPAINITVGRSVISQGRTQHRRREGNCPPKRNCLNQVHTYSDRAYRWLCYSQLASFPGPPQRGLPGNEVNGSLVSQARPTNLSADRFKYAFPVLKAIRAVDWAKC